MEQKNDNIDDNLINSLLQSTELKAIIKKLVNNEIKHNSGTQESAIEKLTEIFSSTNINIEDRAPLSRPAKHSSTIPINDLRSEKSNYSKIDIAERCALASLFRLIDMEGWAKSIYNIVSFRSTTDTSDSYYINPFGLLYHEVTASSLIKVDNEDRVLDHGSTILTINHTNWSLHKAIYLARKDVKCIVQVSLPDVVAISSIKSGLLPVSVEAVKLLDVSSKSISGGGVKYHSQTAADNKYNKLIDDLEGSKIIFLRNYCLLVCASSVAEAWTLTKTTVTACEAQIRLIQLGGKDLLKSESNFTKMNTLFSDVKFDQRNSGETDINLEAELEYEAMMRLLDKAGYRTGHEYREIVHNHPHIVHINNNNNTMVKTEQREEEEETVQVCPLPQEQLCPNGDGITDEHDEDDSEHCDRDSVDLHCVENDREEQREQHERNVVEEICSEVIDNSIRICLNDEPQSHQENDNA